MLHSELDGPVLQNFRRWASAPSGGPISPAPVIREVKLKQVGFGCLTARFKKNKTKQHKGGRGEGSGEGGRKKKSKRFLDKHYPEHKILPWCSYPVHLQRQGKPLL